jgi:xanthine phosphoribosyltransferase
MKMLEEKILAEGKAMGEDILKVDSFVNHQVDPVLMQQIGTAFADHFKDKGVTKVVTIESSGIAPALMTALALNVPMVILKKQPSKVLNDDLYQTVVTSFTKGTSYELTLSQKFISESDHVLIIDDFLANGEAATGAIRLIRLAHATVAGVGILIEKSFQPGRQKLNDQGFEVYSLARVAKLEKDFISFIPEDSDDN